MLRELFKTEVHKRDKMVLGQTVGGLPVACDVILPDVPPHPIRKGPNCTDGYSAIDHFGN